MVKRKFRIKGPKQLTAIIHKEEKWYVADCPKVGTVSQGKTIESAVKNLKEATECYLEVFPNKAPKGIFNF